MVVSCATIRELFRKFLFFLVVVYVVLNCEVGERSLFLNSDNVFCSVASISMFHFLLNPTYEKRILYVAF